MSMEDFLVSDLSGLIGAVLVLVALGMVAFFAGASYMDRADSALSENNLGRTELADIIAAGDVDATREALRLRAVRLSKLEKTLTQHIPNKEDRDDIIRGTLL